MRETEALPPTLARHIDHVCDCFETSWKVWRSGARPRASDFLTLDIHGDNIFNIELFETDAARLHQESARAARQPRRDMAPDVVALTFIDENTAGMDEFFAQSVSHEHDPNCGLGWKVSRVTE